MASIFQYFSSFLAFQSQLPLASSGAVDDGALSLGPQIPLKTASSRFNCLPSQSCWPTAADWRSLNSTLGGRLQVTEPLAHPCFVDSTSDACKEIKATYGTAFAREAVYGTLQNLKWEQCGVESCQLNPPGSDPEVTGSCSLGRISAYYVNATNEAHVAAAVNFVREHGIRLSIKNTGHDYFGRSAAANSLALWTHNMKKLEYHHSFTLSNCPSSSNLRNIGIMGAGVTAVEAYNYFQNFDMHPTVGAAPSVGVAGGFGLAGGHGPLAPSHGLMVDQAVEFDVVTADGQFRTINQCNDPDLFWAMRGGGGSTFGVLVSYKFQLHPALPLNVYMVEAKLPVNETSSLDVTKSKSHRDIVSAMAMNQIQWSANNISSFNFFYPTKFISILLQPNHDTTALPSLTSQWSAFVSNYPGVHIAENSYKTFDTYAAFGNWTNSPELAKHGLIGVGIAESTRLVPKAQFADYAAIHDLVDAFLHGLQISLERGAGISSGYGQVYATTPANTPDVERRTSVHPAWRDSLWHVVYPGLYYNNLTREEQDAVFDTVGLAVEPLKKLTPESGAYLNEGDFKEKEWKKTFFGEENYEKLLVVKKRYDPEGLFKCWKCVGWEESDDPIDACYGLSGASPAPSVPLGSV